MLFKTDAEKAFGVETYLSPEMELRTGGKYMGWVRLDRWRAMSIRVGRE